MLQATAPIDDLLGRFSGQDGALIPLLQQIQDRYGYLRPSHMEEVAHALRLSSGEVYGVASFYAQFRFVPPGKTTVKVCRGTACHVRGSERLLKDLETMLDCRAGGTSEDFRYSLEKIACFGACGLAPVVVIGTQVYGRLNPERLKKLIHQFERQETGD